MADVRILSFVNQKGGVGKTTTSMLVADALHKMGKRVLVVDGDPQRTAQKWEINSLPEFPAFPVKVESVFGISEVEFARWLERRANEFDYFIIDTPPNLASRELRTALFVADTVIVPFAPHVSSVDALAEVIPLIKSIEDERGRKLDIRVLLNKVDVRLSSERAIVDMASKICPWPIMAAQLKQLGAYKDAANYRTSIYSLAGGKSARAALEQVVEEIIK